MKLKYFKKAKAIWGKDKTKELNSSLFFKCSFNYNEDLKLIITANNFYRVYINGRFIFYGPARDAHEFYRVDTYKLENIKKKNNIIVIEVSGANCNSFYALNCEPFLCCELRNNKRVFRYTGKHFSCFNNDTRLRKVSRFSYQRAFSESYKIDGSFNEFLTKKVSKYQEIDVVRVEKKNFTDRLVDYPQLSFKKYKRFEDGNINFDLNKSSYVDRYMTSDYLKIFEKNQYEIQANDVASSFVYSLENRGETKLQKNQFVTFKNDVSLTGFINLKIEAKENSLIYILFDEINTNNDEHLPANICFYRNTTHNIVTYELEKGVYELCSFEPYTAKYIRVVCLDGCIDIKKLGIIKYENPDKKISYGFKDKKITKIFDAAINTFVQNSVDILTDCPSRERAGWLFDSFFSAEAEQYITGKNVVEKSFLACYLNYKKTSYIPKGMIPMCYPADFNMKESFIPNWSMWYVLELDRYYKRTGDKKLIDDSFKNIKGLLKYFSKFENEYGLLENLNGWIFVEWSACNDLNHVCGVNFPSNMLYSLFLITCGKLLNDANLINKGKNLRKVINELSFDGQFYVDNSTRVNGVLTKTNNLTETCQYYAFYTGIAIIEEKPELFKVLMNCFGPSRDFTNTYPNVSKSNTLPGDYLRLILLNRFGHRNLAAKEAIKYFYNMALITGTLWEREDTSCSLNHCFTSYIINIILNSYFGLLEINKKDHKVLINKKSLKISANVSIPVDDNYLILVKNNGDLQVILPKGYELEWI